MILDEIKKLAKKHNGQRTPGKNNQIHHYGYPIIESVIPFRFWIEADRDIFLAELPIENYRAKGPCDEAEYYWCYVKPDDLNEKFKWNELETELISL